MLKIRRAATDFWREDEREADFLFYLSFLDADNPSPNRRTLVKSERRASENRDMPQQVKIAERDSLRRRFFLDSDVYREVCRDYCDDNKYAMTSNVR